MPRTFPFAETELVPKKSANNPSGVAVVVPVYTAPGPVLSDATGCVEPESTIGPVIMPPDNGKNPARDPVLYPPVSHHVRGGADAGGSNDVNVTLPPTGISIATPTPFASISSRGAG